MSKSAIKVENLSKLYRLGEVGTGTISHDLNRWLARIRGKEDPFAQVGQINDRTQKAESNYVWALKDINFEIEQGEALGIIGKNGAGKSTLLKLLSQITSPTTGEIKAKGRIAALLEVGTGMHPEMTARENIYLNGAILGMRKHEIKAKFDEIIEFAGCAMYVDTPIKRFSSGMRVRLGFAVAAFLEPEILIVDEVLAVGDAEFQKKAIGKMQDVANQQGRTVLFVSHNMQAVKNLCNKGLVIEKGSVSFMGNVEDSINYYINNSYLPESNNSLKSIGNQDVYIQEVSIKNNEIYTDNKIEISVYFSILKDDDAIFDCTLHFYDEFNNCIFYTSTADNNDETKTGKGTYTINFNIPPNILHDGLYRIGEFLIVRNRAQIIYKKNDILHFKVNKNAEIVYGWTGRVGIIRPKFEIKKTFTKAQ